LSAADVTPAVVSSAPPWNSIPPEATRFETNASIVPSLS